MAKNPPAGPCRPSHRQHMVEAAELPPARSDVTRAAQGSYLPRRSLPKGPTGRASAQGGGGGGWARRTTRTSSIFAVQRENSRKVPLGWRLLPEPASGLAIDVGVDPLMVCKPDCHGWGEAPPECPGGPGRVCISRRGQPPSGHGSLNFLEKRRSPDVAAVGLFIRRANVLQFDATERTALA